MKTIKELEAEEETCHFHEERDIRGTINTLKDVLKLIEKFLKDFDCIPDVANLIEDNPNAPFVIEYKQLKEELKQNIQGK